MPIGVEAVPEDATCEYHRKSNPAKFRKTVDEIIARQRRLEKSFFIPPIKTWPSGPGQRQCSAVKIVALSGRRSKAETEGKALLPYLNQASPGQIGLGFSSVFSL